MNSQTLAGMSEKNYMTCIYLKIVFLWFSPHEYVKRLVDILQGRETMGGLEVSEDHPPPLQNLFSLDNSGHVSLVLVGVHPHTKRPIVPRQHRPRIWTCSGCRLLSYFQIKGYKKIWGTPEW